MRAWVMGLALLPLLATGVARAEDTAPGELARKEAAERMKAGRDLFDDGKYAEARIKYAQACAIAPSVPCTLSLASAEYKSGAYVDALQHFAKAMDKPEFARLPAESRQSLEAMRADATSRTGHLLVESPPGSSITMDGAELGMLSAAAPVDTTPGHHVLTARLGNARYHAEVDATAGETTHVTLAPDNAPAAVPAPAGAARAEGGAPAVSPGPSALTKPAPESGSGPAQLIVTSTLGVLGLASIVVGAVSLAKASSDGSAGQSLVAPCEAGHAAACAQSHADAENEKDEKNVGVGVLVGGGVLAAGAIVSWFALAPKTARRGSAFVVPDVSAHGAGLLVRGRF